MKLEIYDPYDTDGTVYLRLKRIGGNITVVACGRNGEALKNGNLIYFTDHGTIGRLCEVSEDLGFDLDDDEQVKIEGVL